MTQRSRDEPSGRQVFRKQLTDLGYVEGRSIIYETRSIKGNLERFAAAADELVKQKVDVLVASSTSEALAFRNATKTIPIVFVNTSDPVADGLVDSLPRPGANVMGVTSIATVLSGKRLELLKETVPRLSRLAVLGNPQDPRLRQQWKESQARGPRPRPATSFHGSQRYEQAGGHLHARIGRLFRIKSDTPV